MNQNKRVQLVLVMGSIVPLVGFSAAFFMLKDAWRMTEESYQKYSAFWGGNPSEVFSHWLDMVLMSGNAILLAWLMMVAAILRRIRDGVEEFPRFLKTIAIVAFISTGVIGASLDGFHGEGGVFFVHIVFFLPILAASAFLLRKVGEMISWRLIPVLVLSVLYALANVIAQLFYEPSSSGAPNLFIVPIWLGSVILAITWARIGKAGPQAQSAVVES